ncbi:hypothetical protein ACWD6R_11490 [Streptomyces sp. NPDC005151]
MSRNRPTRGNSSIRAAGEPAAVYCRISQADDDDQTGVDRQERSARTAAASRRLPARRDDRGDLLAADDYDWTQSQLATAKAHNVFAILWGGSGTNQRRLNPRLTPDTTPCVPQPATDEGARR